MILLKAPLNSISPTISYFPNPDLGDSEAPAVEINAKEAISGKPWVYTKRGQYTTLVFTWSNLPRAKMIEMEEFLKEHSGDQLELTDHNDRVWRGYFDDDTIEFTTTGRNAPHGPGRQELGSVTLRFLVKEVV